MTRQEAIKYLIKVRDNCDLDRCPDFNSQMDGITCANCEEAVDMAIKTLVKEWKEEYDHSKSAWENIKEGNGISKEIPKEPSEDLISREDAIDALARSSVYAWSVKEDQIAHNWALKIISELPAKG